MKEAPAKSLDIRAVMNALDPVRRYAGYDLEMLVDDLERSKDPNIHVVKHLLGEADITLTHGKREYVYELKFTDTSSESNKPDRLVRVVSQTTFATYSKDKKEGDKDEVHLRTRIDRFSYSKGKLTIRKAEEDGSHLPTDTYSDDVFRLTRPPVVIPVFSVERTYAQSSGKPKDSWTLTDILTNYFPESWATDAFRSFIDSDPFLPQYKDESEWTKKLDAKNDVKVRQGQIVERVIRFPTLPPDRRIRATLRVDQWFPDPVKLSLVETELIDFKPAAKPV